ncbi:MAG TPA: Crp/Fnr family transcriptional regulator [Candidatus Brocadiia bacterium]|nr:Crp/Fnr family transcriptional regulator [Candidatus Brocadiia bacterium]
MKSLRVSLDEKVKALGACPIFSGLAGTDLRRLAGVVSLRVFEAGELLFTQGAAAEGFYALVSGGARVFRFGQDGREQALHLFGPGELCGEVPVFHGGKYPASAAAQGETQAFYVPGKAFLDLAFERPGMLLEMLAELSSRLRRFVGLIDDLSLKEAPARLAKALLDMRVQQGRDDVRLEMAKGALASRLGVNAATLSRTFRKMEDRGVIAVKGRTIRVLDAAGLGALAAGEKL